MFNVLSRVFRDFSVSAPATSPQLSSFLTLPHSWKSRFPNILFLYFMKINSVHSSATLMTFLWHLSPSLWNIKATPPSHCPSVCFFLVPHLTSGPPPKAVSHAFSVGNSCACFSRLAFSSGIQKHPFNSKWPAQFMSITLNPAHCWVHMLPPQPLRCLPCLQMFKFALSRLIRAPSAMTLKHTLPALLPQRHFTTSNVPLTSPPEFVSWTRPVPIIPFTAIPSKDADRMILLMITKSWHLIPQHLHWHPATYSRWFLSSLGHSLVYRLPVLGSASTSCTWFCFLLNLFSCDLECHAPHLLVKNSPVHLCLTQMASSLVNFSWSQQKIIC